jgi:hypothetical protein
MRVLCLSTTWSSFIVFYPFPIFERESPVVATKGEEETLDALLAVEDHMVGRRRIHLRHLRSVRGTSAVHDRPERTKRNTFQLLVVDLPQEECAEWPTTNQ